MAISAMKEVKRNTHFQQFNCIGFLFLRRMWSG